MGGLVCGGLVPGGLLYRGLKLLFVVGLVSFEKRQSKFKAWQAACYVVGSIDNTSLSVVMTI